MSIFGNISFLSRKRRKCNEKLDLPFRFTRKTTERRGQPSPEEGAALQAWVLTAAPRLWQG